MRYVGVGELYGEFYLWRLAGAAHDFVQSFGVVFYDLYDGHQPMDGRPPRRVAIRTRARAVDDGRLVRGTFRRRHGLVFQTQRAPLGLGRRRRICSFVIGQLANRSTGVTAHNVAGRPDDSRGGKRADIRFTYRHWRRDGGRVHRAAPFTNTRRGCPACGGAHPRHRPSHRRIHQFIGRAAIGTRVFEPRKIILTIPENSSG